MKPLIPARVSASMQTRPGHNGNHLLTGLVLLFFTLHVLLPAAAGYNYGGGSGSADDAYLICTTTATGRNLSAMRPSTLLILPSSRATGFWECSCNGLRFFLQSSPAESVFRGSATAIPTGSTAMSFRMFSRTLPSRWFFLCKKLFYRLCRSSTMN